MREYRNLIVELEQRASVDVEHFDEPPLCVLDGGVHAIGIQVDEPGRNVRDQRLERDTLLDALPQLGIEARP